MKRFTLTWLPTADRRLADLWLSSKNQASFTAAANRIEQLLASDPLGSGKKVTLNLFEIEVNPLVIVFRISEPDRLVEVVDVIELGPLAP